MEKIEKMESPGFKSEVGGKKIMIGILLVGLGAAWLTHNMGMMPHAIWDAIISWQTLLIAIGLVNVVNRQGRGFGVVLIIIGGFFLLGEFYYIPLTLRKAFWPSMLILGGIALLFGGQRICRKRHHSLGKGEDYFEEIAVFGGKNRYVTTSSFKGGKVISIFGGSELDLTGAKMVDESCVIENVSIFGGSTLIVPSDWNVKLEVFSIFGAYEDKRRIREVDFNKTLVIKGVVIFGGGDIKSI